MFKTIRNYLLGVFFLTFLFFPANNVLSIEDAILAVVNDEIITLKDLKNYFHSAYIQLKLQGHTDKQIEQIMSGFQTKGLEKLIEDKLILGEANKLEMEVNEAVINEEIQKIKSKYASEDDFLNALLKDGLTVTDLRNKFQDQLKMKFVVEKSVKSKITINPQEVTDYYNNNKDMFYRPAGRNLDSIYLSTREDAQKAKETAQEALELLKEGKSFEEVAQQYSQTPSIGFVGKGQLLPDVEKSVFSLKEEISPLIEVEGGIFIFKVKAVVPSQSIPLEDVKEEITKKLFEKKFKARFEDWIADIKRDAFIEINQ